MSNPWILGDQVVRKLVINLEMSCFQDTLMLQAPTVSVTTNLFISFRELHSTK